MFIGQGLQPHVYLRMVLCLIDLLLSFFVDQRVG